MALTVRTGSGGSAPLSLANKGCGTLFFGAFLAAGLFFSWAIVNAVVQATATRSWTRTSCTIESSGARRTGHADSPYGFDVSYAYQADGATYQSKRISLSTAGYSDYSKVESALERYRPGAGVECWFDPKNPSQAVLEQSSRAIGFFILLPLVFVLIGGGGVYAMWRTPAPAEAKRASRIQPTVGTGASRAARWVPAIVFGAFGVAGLVVGYFLIGSAREALDARTWLATACTVESSTVGEHQSSSDGRTSYTYSVDILYRYEAAGRTHRSSRYQFLAGSSSGRAAKQQIVDQYPPGREFTCYVSPRDPAHAVIDRELGARVLLLALPVGMVLLGLLGFAGTSRAQRRSAPAEPAFSARAAGGIDRRHLAACAFLPPIPGDGGPVTLRPESTPLGKLIGMTLVALFWNGIVSVFVWQVVQGFRSGSPEWFLTLFLIPFVLIGLGFVGGVVYTALALINPRPVVKLRSAAVPLGGKLEIAWEITGRTHVLDRLQIWLEGVEEVTYRRGTTTQTERHTFRKIEVLSSDDPRDFQQGRESVVVPITSMHSFEAPSNKIVWSLAVEGNIPRWPNMSERFKVVVLPREPDAPEGSA